jgi:ferrochelatase
MEANHEFKEHGGEEFSIPCLNDSDEWCQTVGNWITMGNCRKTIA